MKTTGIIAEYNPLHNGHVYHMGKARELTGCDAVVIAMSGDYVQRGEPALMDKWTRTSLALEAGADLVIEIPVLSCLGNAGQYANAGVRLLEALGCSFIAFGSECGNIDLLTDITRFLDENHAELLEEVRSYSSQGMNYPVAYAHAYKAVRSRSLSSVSGTVSQEDSEAARIERELRVLESSNDILALEYIRSIRTAKPVVIKREGAGYSDPYDIRFDYQSASAIRTQLSDGRDPSRYVPEYTAAALSGAHLTWPDSNIWYDLLRYAVMTTPAYSIEDCPSGGEGLANLLKAKLEDAEKWTQLVRRVKSRRYTYTRISRLCMQVVLGITRSDFGDLYDPGYVRVLGFTDRGRELLSSVRKNETSPLPVITNINKEKHLLDERSLRSLALDVHASDIYNLATGRDLAADSDHRKTPVVFKQIH